MKRFFLTVVVFSMFSLIGYTQTAEQIITKHLEVTGGVNNWKGLKSTVLKGEMVLGVNESYLVEIYQQRPNLNKTTMIIQGKNIILNGYNGKKAVQFNFNTNKLEISPDYTPETFDSDLIDYRNKGFQVVLEGTEKTGKSECYKIKLVKNKDTHIYYFDVKSYQLIKESNQVETKTYSNFQKSSGLTFPYRIEVKSADGESDFVLILKNIEINKSIPTKEFQF